MSIREIFFSLFTVILVGGFVFINTEKIRSGPSVTIISPTPGTRVKSPVILEGITKLADEIKINERVIFITPERKFREVLALPKGYNDIEVYARSRDGRESREVISYIIE